jgi:hypothetical protein
VAEESDIFPIVKILEDINQADKSSASSKYIKQEELPEPESTSQHEYFTNALSLIIKSMESIQRGIQGIEKVHAKDKSTKAYEPASRVSDLNNKTVDSKQKSNKTEDKSATKISSTLSDVEKQRYKSIFEIFSKTVEISKFTKDSTPNTAPRAVDRVKSIIPKIFSLPSKVIEKVSSISSKYGFKVAGDTPYDFKALEKTVKGQGLKVLNYDPKTYSRDQPLKSAVVNKVKDNAKEIVPKISALPSTKKVVKEAANFTPKITAIPATVSKTVNQVVNNIVNKYREIVPKSTTPRVTNKAAEKIKDIAPKAVSTPTFVNRTVNNVINKAKEIITKTKTLSAANKAAEKIKETPSKAPVVTIINKIKEIITRVVKTPTSIKREVSKVLPTSSKTALVPFVNKAEDNKLLINPEEKKPEEKSLAVVNNNLTETEKQKYKVIAEIFGKILEIGKFVKGPEANRLKIDTTDNKVFKETLPPTIKDITPKEPVTNSKPDTGKGGISLNTIIGLALAYDLLNNNFSGIVQSLYRTVKSLGPQVSRTLSLFKRTVGPALSSIGTGIERAASTIKEAFKGKAASISKTLNNAAASIGRVLDTESIFGKLKDKIKPVFDDVASTLSQGLIKLKDKFKSGLDDAITTLSQSINNGITRIVEGAKGAVSTAADKAAQLAKAGASAVASGASKAASSVASVAGKGASAVASVAGKGASAVAAGASKVMSSVQSSLPSKANRVIDFIKSGAAAATSVAGKGVELAKSVGGKGVELAKAGASAVASGASAVVSDVKSVAGKAASAVKSVAGKGAELIKSGALEPLKAYLDGVFSRARLEWGSPRGIIKKLAKVTKAVSSKLGTKIPVVGSLVEMFFGKGQIDEYKKMRASNQIKSDDELYFLAGQRLSQGVAGLLGGAAGAAAAGIALNALPVGALATMLSGGAATGAATLAGGLLGDIIGRLGAKVVTNYLIPPETTRAFGKALVDSPIKEEELQDFLVKDNKVYKFNDKDEVLGMKAGGAINNLISSIIAIKDKQYNVISSQFNNIKKIIPELPNMFKNSKETTIKVVREASSAVSIRASKAVNNIKEIVPNINLKVNSMPATVNKAVDLASREVKDRVYSFKNKSEVLGKKAENSFNNLIPSITNTNEKQFSIASRQVKILEEIRDGIRALASKESNNINNYNNTSGGRKKETRPSLSPFNLRSEFDSMNNIATI